MHEDSLHAKLARDGARVLRARAAKRGKHMLADVQAAGLHSSRKVASSLRICCKAARRAAAVLDLLMASATQHHSSEQTSPASS